MTVTARGAPGQRMLLARLGAISYVVWAILHFQAAWATYKLGTDMPSGIADGRVLQDSWNLTWFSIIAIGSAVALNWKNDPRGWWINLIVVSVADVGFVLFVLIPGYLPVWPGLAGPVFWLLGFALTTAARPWTRQHKTTPIEGIL